MPERRRTHWSWLGRVDYAAADALQREIRDALRSGAGPERLLLLEHPPVFTLGRNAGPDDLRWNADERGRRGVVVHESDRGGQVTYHGPGQLVGYPILDLRPDRRDVRRYVRDLQETLVATLAGFGIVAAGGEGETIGVWTGGRKIASIGIHLSRWITTHGFALNVAPDLGHFGGIVACGLPDVEMTSIGRERGVPAVVEEVARAVLAPFADRFERDLVADPEFSASAPRALAAEATEAAPASP